MCLIITYSMPQCTVVAKQDLERHIEYCTYLTKYLDF